MSSHRQVRAVRVLTVVLAIGLLCAATAAAQEAVGTQPGEIQKKRAAASFLSVLIVLLVLFFVFIGLMTVLRNRLVPRRRPKRRPPTDATDLWSLAGQEEARRKAGKKEPPQPKHPTEPDAPQDDH